MARYDVYANPDGPGFLLDCQADVLSFLNTRFIVPLLPIAQAPPPARRLNPVFVVDGRQVVMLTQFAAAILTSRLGRQVGTLRADDYAIANALDMLIAGF